MEQEVKKVSAREKAPKVDRMIKALQEEYDNLHDLNSEERIKKIKKYINRINVFFDQKSKKHSLHLNLELPLVGDIYKLNDKIKKQKKYEIKEGSNQKVVHLEKGVRNLRINQELVNGK